MHRQDDWLIVGTIVAAQGLKGALRVKPDSDFAERFTQPGKRWIKKSNKAPEEVELIAGHKLPGKEIYVITFRLINTREHAEGKIGYKLLVPSSSRPPLCENEYHYLDLVGLKVKFNSEQDVLGEVTNLLSAGNDLLEIKLKSDKKVLIPFVKEIVPTVDLQNGWIIINPPPGLLDL